MDDPVTMLVKATTHVCITIGCALGDALRSLIISGSQPRSRRSKKVMKAELAKQTESRREAGCKQVVLDFAGAFGYMTHEAISPGELNHKIGWCPSIAWMNMHNAYMLAVHA